MAFNFGSSSSSNEANTPAPGASFSFQTARSTGSGGDPSKISASGGLFSLGMTPTTGAAPAASSGSTVPSFSLGGSGTAAPAPPVGTGSFSFGRGTAPVGTEKPKDEVSSSTPSVPVFGAPASVAAAGSAFSFGSKDAATTSADGTKPGDSSKAPAPATLGFSLGPDAGSKPSFGAAPAATPGDSTKAPAAGAFSFGGDAASKPTFGAAPAAAPGDSTKARAAGAFSFGGEAASKPTFGAAPAAAPSDSTKAPAAGAFSFGGDAASKPTFGAASAAAPSDSTKAPAQIASGFSFGTNTGASSKSKSTSATPSVGSFSFGNKTADSKTTPPPFTPADATTPATPAGVATPSTPAPVQTPGTMASTTTPAATSTATPKEPSPVEYQTLSVEQIINKFQAELEKDALKYIKEADRVAHYDAILRDSQRTLSHLADDTLRLGAQQTELENILKGLDAFQTELDGNLGALEKHVDEMFVAQAHLSPQDADVERERAYATAGTLDRRLTGLSDQLHTTLQQLDASQERTFGQGDVGAIVRILNQHQNALVQLESKSRGMEQDISEVTRVLQHGR